MTWKWPGFDEAGDVHDVKLKSGPKGVKKFQSEAASTDYSFKRKLTVSGHLQARLHPPRGDDADDQGPEVGRQPGPLRRTWVFVLTPRARLTSWASAMYSWKATLTGWWVVSCVVSPYFTRSCSGS